MKISGQILRFFVFLLLSAFLSYSDAYALDEESRQEAEENNEKIISIVQTGIGLLKYEIQRDQEFASRKMLISTLRQLRQILKNDIGTKEQLINNLKSYLSEKMPAEIESLQSTLEEEKKIIKSFQISKRVRRVTRNTIKGLIPIKEKVLASFE